MPMGCRGCLGLLMAEVSLFSFPADGRGQSCIILFFWVCMCIVLTVSWHLNEDPKLISSGTVAEDGVASVAMSPDGRVVAIATSTNINLYNSETTELMDTLESIHSGNVF